MKTPISKSFSPLYPSSNDHNIQDFDSFFSHLNSTFFNQPCSKSSRIFKPRLGFSSTSTSFETENTILEKPVYLNWLKPGHKDATVANSLFKNLSVFEKALIGAGGGGLAGAFTHVCLHPLDTIKTKLQTKGAKDMYNGPFDAIVKTFQSNGILGFYSGISAVIVGSTFSSAMYFGSCEFGKSILSKLEYPTVLIPPTAGAFGNIISSAIMVPKELITQRMQTGAKGGSLQVLMRIVEKDGVLGLYAGYSATLLRNLPAGVLSYSSFEYLKAAVLSSTKQKDMNPFQSVICGALAGAIAATLTTPLDVVKTRLMTQVRTDAAAGVSATLKQIMMEEGWVGFTQGMGPRIVHSACFSALGFFAFETARLTLLHQYLKRKQLLQDNLSLVVPLK
ncbi:protein MITOFERRINLIKE 1, chloroplastic [Heracleum sosnowskyi]|uniref:Protein MITOFERRINLIKE 1, chloroplastic n=1 Tax=Heracleum sosnowskyi TaxID=360622 RepID=A0AAD8IE61_9APIA|nr:protein MITOFERRINLIKE 1, chloroplastic [Heracleum sosnowskyi]